MAKPLYITTTLPYVNADPHIGFAVELLQADVLARAARLEGREVFFNTGTDEHGQKIWEKAQESGEEIQAYVDRYAASVRNLKDLLGLSCDTFIRTTDERHIAAAQELWQRCDAKGDIEKRKYKGLYCVGCEKFLTQRDLEGGKCPLHPGQEPREVEEENYFFKLSNYQQQLEECLSHERVIVPEHRRQEALDFVKRGLEDFSISREADKLPWGIPVPGDESQVMYVWFDALTNYISTLGWPDEGGDFKKFWFEGETLQMAGKDQVRFQSIMWQAMLMSADIKTTDRVFYHGFINSGGQRMSKSLGNVIAPADLVEKYGVEATRYLLIKHVHPVEDTDVTWERLDEWYTANLVNGLGNVVARITTMAENFLDEPSQPKFLENLVLEVGENGWRKLLEEDFRLDQALDQIGVLAVKDIDDFIDETKPFKEIKDNPDKAKKDIEEARSRLWTIAKLLGPFMPETSKKILEAIGKNKKPENLFPRLKE